MSQISTMATEIDLPAGKDWIMILQDSSPTRAALALDESKIAFGLLLSTLPGATLHNDPDLLWYETGIATDVYNGVLQSRLSDDAVSVAVGRVVNHFQERHLPFHWHLGPSSRPLAFGDILQSHGICHEEDEPGMAADLHSLDADPLLISSLVVNEVLSESQLREWSRTTFTGAPVEAIAHVFAAYTGLPHGPQCPLRLYLGTVDGEPVATVKLFLAAGVAYIGRVVTIPRFRRNGIGRAMTLHAMHSARRAGYHVAVLTASPMGIDIYRRLGFKECCVVSTYTWKPSTSEDR